MKNYYDILGIGKSASTEEIRKAYHKLAHQHHPDKGGNAQKFKEISEAYQILSNAEKRAQYDQYGRVFDGGSAGNSGTPPWGFNWSWGNPMGSNGFNNDQQEEQESSFDFGNLGDIFGDILGFGGNPRKKNSKKGRDIEADLEIPLESVLTNQEKEISLEKLIKCQRCQGSGAEHGSAVKECFSCRGTGEVQQIRQTFLGAFTSVGVCPECKGEGRKPEKLCNVCRGEGRIKGVEKIKIFIQAGIDQNQVIKVEEAGEQGKRGKKAGDLYIRISIKEHPIFQRKGDDLFSILTIPFSRAVLGGEAEITDLSGKRIILNIPAGAEPGKMLRLTGKGIPHFQGRGQGNLYIELALKIPKKITQEQRELLEKLKEEEL